MNNTVTRLSGAAALSLHTQTSTTPAHTVTLIVMEASDQLSHERLHQRVASSLPQLPRFRSRLVRKPLGIGQPVWAEIDDYDPTPQIHSATVDAPDRGREFADLLAQLSTGAHHRRQPLWEAWSIEGLADGRWALAIRMSPELSDHDTGSLWSSLLTAIRNDDPTDDLPTELAFGTPSLGERVTDAVSEIVENNVTGIWLIAEAVSGVLGAVRGRLFGTNEPDPTRAAASAPVPDDLFNAPLTSRRAVALASVPLASLETVSNAFGGSIGNVFLAAYTLSLRAWLQRHDIVPDHPLLMQMPLALPASEAIGDSFTVEQIRLPVQLEDPLQVLTNLHTAAEQLNTARSQDAEKPGSTVDFTTVASVIPPAIADAGMRLYNGLGLWRLAPTCHGTVSYRSGTPEPAYCAGAEVVGIHTVAPLREGCGVNVTVTSHGDVVDLCVCVCPDNVPAVDEIATGIAESVDVLVAAAHASPRGQGRSVVTEMTSHATKRSHGGARRS